MAPAVKTMRIKTSISRRAYRDERADRWDLLMNDAMEEVTASYYRCRRHDEFIDMFYAFFLSKDQRIVDKFAHTDFRIQKLMLRESLLEMLCFARGMTGARAAIERLGQRHRDLEIQADMYDLWLDSLCEAVQRFDPEYTPQLEAQWRAVMRKGIDLMISFVSDVGS